MSGKHAQDNSGHAARLAENQLAAIAAQALELQDHIDKGSLNRGQETLTPRFFARVRNGIRDP